MQRQNYELELLQHILGESGLPIGQVIDDRTDYPKAEDEGDIFNKGADILVTVAGNKKFKPASFISVDHCLMQGLLGQRIFIIREQDQAQFARIDNLADLQQRIVGIPVTWADADLFRHNGCKVLEQGQFEQVFQYLHQGACDYLSFGANEVESIFATYGKSISGLAIEQTLVVEYPFPLHFYVHPDQVELAQAIGHGIEAVQRSGLFEQVYQRYYGETLRRLNLSFRRPIPMMNPLLTSAQQSTQLSL